MHVIKQLKLPCPLDKPRNLEPLPWAPACCRIIGCHPYGVLAKILEDVHRDFNIKDKVTVTTTDNGLDIVKAFSVFAEVQRTIQDTEEDDEERGHFKRN